MNWALYAVAAFLAASGLLSVASIGRPRKPLTPGQGAAVVVLEATMIVILVLAAVRLS